MDRVDSKESVERGLSKVGRLAFNSVAAALGLAEKIEIFLSFNIPEGL